ncbi:glycosyltransferase family 2 protein [Uliginosibacterium sp. H3]|uniref:Glycosyltransferase family 2 protein n=1 Tax=Uliginosibacterium silvisoli TaxID=3114758 RepID=A0ABU6K1P8_9RHOO|nr:glycosyltransferase family 2 protein [Uliginosibacterium sp. H3]
MSAQDLSGAPVPDRVVALIVSYNPDVNTLQRLLDSLQGQVDVSIVVDNGSRDDIGLAAMVRTEGEELIALGRNMGIAHAQNVGIARARELGATQLVFFDHDSCPADGMVKALRTSLHWLGTQGRRVGSIGPSYVDERQGSVPVFVRVRGLSLTRCAKPELGDVVAVDHLIASGCMIPMAVLNDVGDMRSDLFIDYVDVEWGLRAQSMGYENFGCFSAWMQHSLGDDPIIFRGAAYPARSPLRHYYTFRNAVLVSRLSYVPGAWKCANGLRTAQKFVFYALFGKSRLQQLKMMTLGLWHGLMGRTGPFCPGA